MTLEFFPEARLEAEEAVRFYESRLPGLGVRFRRELEASTSAILRQPQLWRERIGGYRRANLPGFPYYIAFFVRDERVTVVAIGHASRHPKYWFRRME